MKHLFVPERPPAVHPAGARRPRRSDRRIPSHPVVSRNGQLEREVKLSPSPELSLAVLEGTPLETRQFSSVYYDTADRILARIGITLRRRLEHGGSLWQLKLPRAAAGSSSKIPAGLQRSRTRIASLLSAVLRDRQLAPVAELRTVRRGVRVEANGSTADVVLDEVAVMDNLRVVSEFDELEIELVEGAPDGLASIEVAVRRAGAEDGDGRPKVLRVLGHSGPASRPAATSRPISPTSTSSSSPTIPARRSATTRRISTTLRVAVRRLRAILKVAAPPLDEAWADDLRAELDWLGERSGQVRDLDVMIAYFRQGRRTSTRRSGAPSLRCSSAWSASGARAAGRCSPR